jgi:hypothetical protein
MSDEKEFSRGIEEQEAIFGGCATMLFIRLLQGGAILTGAWILTHLSPGADNTEAIRTAIGLPAIVTGGGEYLIRSGRTDIAEDFENN